MEQLFSDSRIYSKLGTEQSTSILKQPFTNFHIQLSRNTQFHSFFDHAKTAMYSQTCRLLSSLKNSLIKISSFWQTQLIQVISLCSQLIMGRNDLTIRMSISITILHSHDLRELRTKIKKKDTIKWIIGCVVHHNLLADLKDPWNELYEEDEPDSAPVRTTLTTHPMGYVAPYTQLLFPILKTLSQ
ncbi:hypothetical protein VP01_2801g1 [Puccinia sorghi]|uniref:Uncharacterized protein n=1 Tax=Puccinia sorghi TaxID=27349 RepID=A0A0L6V2J7_9BASI|nr:hypothetical protein VP01_2801g1 [Puccinia sorghi]